MPTQASTGSNGLEGATTATVSPGFSAGGNRNGQRAGTVCPLPPGDGCRLLRRSASALIRSGVVLEIIPRTSRRGRTCVIYRRLDVPSGSRRRIEVGSGLWRNRRSFRDGRRGEAAIELAGLGSLQTGGCIGVSGFHPQHAAPSIGSLAG